MTSKAQGRPIIRLNVYVHITTCIITSCQINGVATRRRLPESDPQRAKKEEVVFCLLTPRVFFVFDFRGCKIMDRG
jgi:hypothetical protein